MSKKNRILLGFRVAAFNDITHDDITEMTGNGPIKIFIKGEKRTRPSIQKQNIWIMDNGCSPYDNFETQLDAMLDIIESKADVFKLLTTKYECDFSCGLYLYSDNNESAPSVNLTYRYHKIIRELELNLSFDIDIIRLADSTGMDINDILS